MTTLVIQVFDTPDGLLCRCPQHAAWRPSPSEQLDRPKLEKSLKGHATRTTRIEWYGWPTPTMEGLGWTT